MLCFVLPWDGIQMQCWNTDFTQPGILGNFFSKFYRCWVLDPDLNLIAQIWAQSGFGRRFGLVPAPTCREAWRLQIQSKKPTKTPASCSYRFKLVLDSETLKTLCKTTPVLLDRRWKWWRKCQKQIGTGSQFFRKQSEREFGEQRDEYLSLITASSDCACAMGMGTELSVPPVLTSHSSRTGNCLWHSMLVSSLPMSLYRLGELLDAIVWIIPMWEHQSSAKSCAQTSCDVLEHITWSKD